MSSLEEHDQVLAISRLVDKWAEENLGDDPDWAPLEAAVPVEWCGGFMWMQRVVQDGTTIELYKQGITRRYLNLDNRGGAHLYTGSDYKAIPVEEAIDHVFDGIEEMGWSRETNYDDEFKAEKYRAFRDAGWTVITTGSGMPLLEPENENTNSDHGQQSDRRDN